MGVIQTIGYSLLILIIIAVVISTILYFTTDVFKPKENPVTTTPNVPVVTPTVPAATPTDTPVVAPNVPAATPTDTPVVTPNVPVTTPETTPEVPVPAPVVPELSPCYQGDVTIWWGHKASDATWACNSWKSSCANAGGCVASGDGTVVNGKSTWKCNLKSNCK